MARPATASGRNRSTVANHQRRREITRASTRIEQRCDQTPRPDNGDTRMSRVVGAVKGAFVREVPQNEKCHAVPVQREFRRPIAYDVDYTYRGAKYRSRLPEDPGDRVRIRVSVMPVPAQ